MPSVGNSTHPLVIALTTQAMEVIATENLRTGRPVKKNVGSSLAQPVIPGNIGA
jgi:hypothetical protein